MPELPEVESVVRNLRDESPSLLNRQILAVQIVWQGAVTADDPAEFRRYLTGARCVSISRHGKYIILGLLTSSGVNKYLIIHLRMTGRLNLVPTETALSIHTRLALVLEGSLSLRFDDPRKFGRAQLVDEPATVLCELGPDALDVTFEEFAGRCRTYRRQLKPLLLDQSFIAGIGNIYADESLFHAGLHPLRNSGDLSPDDQRRLYNSVSLVLREAVAAQGANIDGVFKAGRFVVAVYGRQGQPCPRCGTPIEKIRVGQRGTHFCPCCQQKS